MLVSQYKNRIGRKKHGMSKTPIYRRWEKMIARVMRPELSSSPTMYSKIDIDPKWFAFQEFYKDMGELPTLKHTLDRVDNNKGYCKNNCKWATHYEQQQHKTNTIWITYRNKKQNLKQWCKELNISYDTIYKRYKNNDRIPRNLLSIVGSISGKRIANFKTLC